mmetsp:Transcript_36068/g.84563  ORF Transcript_36068/g.84563 Transcript_36068/m.84563 type:complete len:291 (+) Transcript_36068:83-955(+)
MPEEGRMSAGRRFGAWVSSICGTEQRCLVQEAGQPSAASSSSSSAKGRLAPSSPMDKSRAQVAWGRYCDFVAAPGHKCSRCWLLQTHCCCSGIPEVCLRPHVVLVMHFSELEKHLGSNTAKVLLLFGAELIARGVPEQDQRLQEILDADPEGCAVLFPSPEAQAAVDIAAHNRLLQSENPGFASERRFPRCIIVLDGGWRECRKIDAAIPPHIRRCIVTTASREEYGGTRKYGGTDPKSDQGRVQTAAAFTALMQELEEDPGHVDALKRGLAHFMLCWETQIKRSKKWVT